MEAENSYDIYVGSLYLIKGLSSFSFPSLHTTQLEVRTSHSVSGCQDSLGTCIPTQIQSFFQYPILRMDHVDHIG